MTHNDLVVCIGGEAGMGVESSGVGFCKALTRGGLYVCGVPDYHSRIRGGHNFFSVRLGHQPLYAPIEAVHLLIALDSQTVLRHIDTVVEGGGVVYDAKEDLSHSQTAPGVQMFPVPLSKLAEEKGGREIMRNTVALGVVAGLLDFEPEYIAGVIRDNFARKGQETVDANLRAAEAGVDVGHSLAARFPFRAPVVPNAPHRLILNGNEAFALGALAGGCRFVSGYPMTPGSPVLQWFSGHAADYGVVTKHAEDEIAAINMAIGAAHAGARALVPTSGGGFSLMVEGLGLAGITETPVVIYNAQRPGPATGLPTRHEQADLLFSIFASQGEFPRFVLTPGSIEEAFRIGWHAFNLVERHQTPAVVLGDHFLATTYRTVDMQALDFDTVSIDRGSLLSVDDLDTMEEPYLRYRITESGVSPRAVPGHPHAVYVAASNEHDERGAISESIANRVAQVDKRARKLIGMAQDTPQPTGYGPRDGTTALICWGSTYGAVRETVDILNRNEPGSARMVHFSSLCPFPTEATEKTLVSAQHTVVVEMNSTGQLEKLLRMHTGFTPDGHIRKYDGRAFTPGNILAGLKEVT